MTRALKAGEVLNVRNDLLERLGDSTFSTLIDQFGSMEYGRSGGFKKRDIDPHQPTRLLTSAVKTAECYRVTHDMSMVVEHAASLLDDLDRFDASLAPTGCGFVSFDRPLPIQDQRGMTMLMHFLIWGHVRIDYESTNTSTPGTAFYMFNDTWRQPDEVHQHMLENDPEVQGWDQQTKDEWLRTIGRWAPVGFTAAVKDQRLGPPTTMPSEEAQARLLAEGSIPAPGTNVLRYVHALWLLMNQTVATVEQEKVDRTSMRRATKKRLPPKVTVVRLRREANAERTHGETDVEWAHRWVVRGHWRWQVVSEHHHLAQEIEPGKYRARIWINPFVKGPADKPIVQSEKVYSLER